MLAPFRSLQVSSVERGVAEIESPWFGFRTDFNSFVEELEEHERTSRDSIGQVVTIVSLAATAGELALAGGGEPPVASGGGGAGFGGAGTATVALGRGAVGSLEWVEVMSRLATIGAISTTALARLGAGTGPQPSKPMQSSASEPKTGKASKTEGGAKGGSKVDPAVDKAVEEGLDEYEGPKDSTSQAAPQ